MTKTPTHPNIPYNDLTDYEIVGRPSTPSDYCDTCNARAYWEVKFNAGPLLFCNHHYQNLKQNPAHQNRPTVNIDWNDGYNRP